MSEELGHENQERHANLDNGYYPVVRRDNSGNEFGCRRETDVLGVLTAC